MSASRTVTVAVPNNLHGEPVQAAVAQAVHEVWAEVGLCSRPVVELVDSTSGDTLLDGHPVLVSARRLESAVLAGGGDTRRPGEGGAPRDLLADRLDAGPPAEAAALLCSVVDTTLRADLACLVRPESEQIAEGLCAPGSWYSRVPVPVAAEAVQLLAEFGVAPSHLPQVGFLPELEPESPVDPLRLCEAIMRGSQSAAQLDPVIELHPETLRRLTSGPRPLRTLLVSGTGPTGAKGMKDELFANYGIRLPAISVRAVDQPRHVVRFRFGSLRSPAHLVLPDAMTARIVAGPPTSTEWVGTYTDPLYGEEWVLVEDREPPSGALNEVDPAGLVIRALHSEARVRLAMWAPPAASLFDEFEVPFDREALHLEEASAALRWLASSQAPLHAVARILEAIISAEARHVTTVLGMVDHLRHALGAALQGSIVNATNWDLVEIDEEAAAAAVGAGAAGPLIEAAPALRTSVRQMVVTCPARWRQGIERLLRPVADVAIVVSAEELQAAPLGAP
jgi:hypothetical protein